MSQLARWGDETGKTAGWWLVKETPGLCLRYYRPDRSWRLEALSRDHSELFNLQAETDKAWGEEADWGKALRIVGRQGMGDTRYRQAALIAAEQAAQPGQPQTLQQVTANQNAQSSLKPRPQPTPTPKQPARQKAAAGGTTPQSLNSKA